MQKLFFFTSLLYMLAGCGGSSEPGSYIILAEVPSTETGTATQPFVRKNIYSLAFDGQEIVAMKRGISVMKSKPAEDPTSWAYQAGIHGSSDAPRPNWNQCQHGTFLFLAWHRMYLYYFERILRKSSGAAEFALPYWNYSDDRRQAVLPPAFWNPADGSNPLYNSRRDASVNEGYPLVPSVVSYEGAFRYTDFTTPPGLLSFGGITVSAPTHFTGPHGAIESQPHDQVHMAIGGDMQNPNTAALDPIFWLHHANIDRLWEKWMALGRGRSYPTADEFWMNYKFTFYDENGAEVKMSGSQILDIATQLNYKYDDQYNIEPIKPPVKFVQNEFRLPPPATVLEFARINNVTTQGSITRVSLGNSKAKGMDKFVNAALKNLNDTSQANNMQILLTLDGITFDSMPRGVFEVYFNLPMGKPAEIDNKHYVGNISLFGIEPLKTSQGNHHHGHGEGHTTNSGVTVLDLTPVINALKGNVGNLDISIIHKSAVVQDGVKAKDNNLGEIRIKNISISGVQ